MRFIRKGGRIIPIRDDERGVSKAKAAAVGAAAGAAYHVQQGHKAMVAEKMAKNHRSMKKFIAQLRPGDILVTGTNEKHAGGYQLGDVLPKGIAKKLKPLGIKKSARITDLSSVLATAGAGQKSHAAVYVGKGNVVHAYPDYGVFTHHISEAGDKHNITALRFTNASKREADAAVKFVKSAAKKKVSYQGSHGLKSAFANLVLPIAKKNEKSFSPMVCHTVAARAWSKRKFPLGEHTYAGDLIKAPGITAVARHDVIKNPGIRIKSILGNSAKGLKWGVAAALGAAAINYALKRRRKEK